MANPNAYVYTAAGARTVYAKLEVPDQVTRVSIEDHPLWDRLPHRGIKSPHPERVEDDLQAIDTANAQAYDAEAPEASTTARTTNENYVQRFTKSVTIDHAQEVVAQYGVTNEFDYQLGLRRLELLKDIEAAIISDQAQQAPTPANGRVGKMKGLTTIITSNTDQVADFNKANLDVLIKNTFGTSGGNPTVMWMDLTRKVAFASFAEQVTRYMQAPLKTMINEVQIYNSEVGPTLSIEPHKLMPQDFVGTAAVCFGLDLTRSNLEILDYIPIRFMSLPDTGSGRAGYLEYFGSILIGAQKSCLIFKG